MRGVPLESSRVETRSRKKQKCSRKFKSFLLTAARNNRRNCSHVILIFALGAEKHFHPFSISRKAHFSRMKKFLSWQKEIICFWRNKTSKMCRRMFTALAALFQKKLGGGKEKFPRISFLPYLNLAHEGLAKGNLINNILMALGEFLAGGWCLSLIPKLRREQFQWRSQQTVSWFPTWGRAAPTANDSVFFMFEKFRTEERAKCSRALAFATRRN